MTLRTRGVFSFPAQLYAHAGGANGSIAETPTAMPRLDTWLTVLDVELLTTGGPGLPALVASYARSRGLRFTALLPDHERHPGNAVERRDALLVADADAAVVPADEWYHPDMDRLVKAVRAKRGRVHVVEREKPRGKPVAALSLWRPRGLPD
jgi:hypothetical protein